MCFLRSRDPRLLFDEGCECAVATKDVEKTIEVTPLK